jgi:hypothetical protein
MTAAPGRADDYGDAVVEVVGVRTNTATASIKTRLSSAKRFLSNTT